jgi:phosphopantetheine--protein transferase-like protein
MIDHSSLRASVAGLLRMPPDQIGPETSLKPLQNSLGTTSLNLALKRLGFSLRKGFSPASYGELEAACSGTLTQSDVATPAIRKSDAATGKQGFAIPGVQIGIDVQDIAALPDAADYWQHEFYSETFARAEIAYASLQAEPRAHFAAFWCAKEAVRKCDATFADLPLSSIEVAHEETGKPYLVYDAPSGRHRLPHAVSLSHTSELATAIVVAVAIQPESPSVKESAPSPIAVAAESTANAHASRGVSRNHAALLRSASVVFVLILLLILLRHIGAV